MFPSKQEDMTKNKSYTKKLKYKLAAGILGIFTIQYV